MSIDIGTTIRRLRKSRGMTQQALADAANISKQAISMYEINQRRPSYDVLEAISDALNVPIEIFLKREDMPRRLRDSLDNWDLRQAVHDNPDMLALFSVARRCSPDKLRQAIEIIKVLQGGNDEDPS